MSIEIVRGASRKPVASAKLIDILSHRTDWSGRLFVGYPIARTSTGPNRIDALWISEDKGIVAFDLIEGTDPDDHEFRQDDSANQIERRLRGESGLVKRRRLRLPIHTISFAPAIAPAAADSQSDDYPLAGADSIIHELACFEWPERDLDVYQLALSVIDKVSRIRSGRIKRAIRHEDSRGAKLKRLEDSIATLDHMQSKAILETVDGVQRIRGLAGSGKTIVLALKAAYLHAQYPEWRIAVTFSTRSLKGFYRRLIRDFHFDQTEEEPDWQNLRIVNCWGAPGAAERDGIYHEFCLGHGVDYLDFRSAKARFGGQRPFDGACKQALDGVREHRPMYDALLVDEAQDLPPAFLGLCYAFLREPRRLVYAYDELQNLSGESLPSPEDIFGRTEEGVSRVRFDDEGGDRPRHDVVLHTCYRNSRPVLVTAHALGFGIYRPPPKKGGSGLVQMFDHPNLWEAVGYRVRDGELRENAEVMLSRTRETSPEFLEDHSTVDDLIRFKSFTGEIEQAEWLADQIGRNLNEDDLHHGDIMVINPDPLTTRKKVGVIRAMLLDMGIQSHLAGVDTDPDVFLELDVPSVTFTGIHRAKGNEAGMVYIINADDCQADAFDLARIRNRLFTAITRSKAWVRVLGVGRRMQELTREFQELKDRGFALGFRYPSAEERARLRVIHRDMNQAERRRVEGNNRNLGGLIRDIERGDVHVEDLDETVLDKLTTILQQRSR
ncbi:MAG: ATP-binding domain-containing protein [Thiotrichales bacterium]|nr:ATP-binding domain-containing protein [Thiotrichales bacterium]